MLKSYKNINNFVKNTNDDNFSDFADDILFSDILDLWLKESRLKVKQSSINKYEYLINKHIKPQLGSYKMSQLNSEIINNFTQSKLLYGRLDSTGGLANSYVRSINIVISSAIKFAIEKNIYVPIFKPIYKPTIEKRVLKILPQKEQKKLEEHLYKHLDPTAIGILLTLYAGLRIGEVCALTWDDIDLEEKIIRVRSTIIRTISEDGKVELKIDKAKTNNSIRDIPLTSNLYTILSNVKRAAKTKFVVSTTDNFVSPRTYEYRYKKIMSQAKIKFINYHALRHTFATRCVEADVDIKSLSEFLGHSNVSTTLNIYVHSSIEMKRKQIQKLTDYQQTE